MLLEAVVVERLADRGDAAVHHVARRDDVGARLDVADGGAGEQLEAAVVVHLAVDDHAAVAVRGVLAEADVGHQHELGEAGPQRAQRLLDDPVLLPRAGRLLVLPVRDPEQHHGADAASPRARRPRAGDRRGRAAPSRAAPRSRAARARRRAAARTGRARAASRARARAARAVRRKRRSRTSGKLLTAEEYAALDPERRRTGPSWPRPGTWYRTSAAGDDARPS